VHLETQDTNLTKHKLTCPLSANFFKMRRRSKSSEISRFTGCQFTSRNSLGYRIHNVLRCDVNLDDRRQVAI